MPLLTECVSVQTCVLIVVPTSHEIFMHGPDITRMSMLCGMDRYPCGSLLELGALCLLPIPSVRQIRPIESLREKRN